MSLATITERRVGNFTERRVGNFAEKKTWRCLYCGKDIENPVDLYSRRFCTTACKDAYFSSV